MATDNQVSRAILSGNGARIKEIIAEIAQTGVDTTELQQAVDDLVTQAEDFETRIAALEAVE